MPCTRLEKGCGKPDTLDSCSDGFEDSCTGDSRPAMIREGHEPPCRELRNPKQGCQIKVLYALTRPWAASKLNTALLGTHPTVVVYCLNMSEAWRAKGSRPPCTPIEDGRAGLRAQDWPTTQMTMPAHRGPYMSSHGPGHDLFLHPYDRPSKDS